MNLQIFLLEIRAQTIYQMKSQHQLRKKSNFLTLYKGNQIRAKSPTRSHSKTNYTQNEQAKQQAKEIEELKKEIAQLKQNQNDELRNKETKTNDQNDHSKNLQEASNNRCQNRSNRSNEFHPRNNSNFTKLQRTIKTSRKQRHDPDG